MDSLIQIFRSKKLFGPCWVFASLNIITGTWVLYIPMIKNKLQLDDGQLGLALFCFAFGVICLLPFVPKILKRFGVGKTTIVAILAFACSYLLPFYAESYLQLCIILFFVGAWSGLTDIAMNALVSEIEHSEETNFMSAAHGFFSLGGVIGAGIGSLIITSVTDPVYHMLMAIAFVGGSNLLLAKNYSYIFGHHEEKEKSSLVLKKLQPLFWVAIIAMIIMGSEGAIEHWSKLFLLEVSQVSSDQLAGLGFVLFSVFMTIGRFFGDGISSKIGSNRTIMYGIILATLGFILLVSSYQYMYATFVGFALIGMGFSVVIPELFRLAGNSKAVSSSLGITFVSGLGFVGFLSGPVVLGMVSNWAGLRSSFILLTMLAGLAVLLVLIFKDKD